MAKKTNELVSNRKAFHDYEIIQTYEAGIVLLGSEIKSLRNHGGSLQDAYVKVIKDEILLINAYIAPYQYISFFQNVQILISTVGWSLKLWNVTTYQLLMTIDRRWYSGDIVSISPNSQIIAIDPRNGTTLLWKVYGSGG